ncbi:unnamed protein product [Discosporangium mesarthrocarpum]
MESSEGMKESAYGFRNIKPMTRPERRALKDKVALERSRLMQRAGYAAKIYRDNVPPEGVSLTELTSEAAGFIADADRFHSDTVGEEHLRRRAEYQKKTQIHDNRRQLRVEREDKRWAEMERKAVDDEERWSKLREAGEKAKKNQSGVPYNMINLRYDDGLDGARLEHSDNCTKHRAQRRSNNLMRLGDTRCGYNILTGKPRVELIDPQPPQPTEALEKWTSAKGHA